MFRLTSSKTTKFVKGFLVFSNLFALKFGGDELIQTVDAVQVSAQLANSLLSQVWVPIFSPLHSSGRRFRDGLRASADSRRSKGLRANGEEDLRGGNHQVADWDARSHTGKLRQILESSIAGKIFVNFYTQI